MKTFVVVAAVALMLTSIAAEARTRTRVTVRPAPRPVVQHPVGVDYVLRSILCSFHLFSIGPQGTPGSCIEYMPRRRMV